MNRKILAASIRATGLAIVAMMGAAVTSQSMADDHLAQAGAKGAATGAYNATIAKETGVPLEALRGIPLEQALRIPKDDNDPEVQRLREAALQALQEGRFQDVDELLRQARERVHAAGETTDATRQASRKRAAELAFEQASAARLQVTPTAYRKAADLFGEAARLAADDVHKAREYQLQQASVLDDLGREFGDNDVLREAIALYQQILSGIDRATDPLDWARTQNNLGIALGTLGEREGNAARLHEAITAYRAALEERTRERAPLDWAMTQNNLGNALLRLGEREGGTERLHEAVAAYHAALKERTRERVPLKWAMTQNNLGITLRTLGKQEGDTKLLEKALAAHRAALSTYEASGASHDAEDARHNLALSEAALASVRKD
jgi:tetratricopeptide (TPR) repeat protein